MSADQAAEKAAPSAPAGMPKYPQLVTVVRDLTARVERLEAALGELQQQPPAAPQARPPELGDEYCPGCGSRLDAGHFDHCPDDPERRDA